MSIWGVLRTKKLWISAAISIVILLAAWAIGALLIESGTVPITMMNGWITGSSMLAGFIGGQLLCRKQRGGLTAAITLAIVIIILELILTLSLFGGVNFKDGAWKSMLFFMIGSILAGLTRAAGQGRRRHKAKSPLRNASSKKR